MRALKALVIVMGVLLVAGSVTIAVLILHRLSTGHPLGHGGALPATAELDLPADGRIEEMAGVGDRLAVRIARPDGEAILLFDPATGRLLQTIRVRRSAPEVSP